MDAISVSEPAGDNELNCTLSPAPQPVRWLHGAAATSKRASENEELVRPMQPTISKGVNNEDLSNSCKQ